MTTPPTYQTPRPLAQTSTRPKAKKRLRDYAAEDKRAVERGRIDLLIDPQILGQPEKLGGRGRPKLYADELVFAGGTLKKMFRLAYRPLEGLLISLAVFSGYEGPTPDFTTLCRRMGALDLPPLPRPKGPLTVVVDSTGVTTFCPGEWRVYQDREQYERQYLKFHAVRDEATGHILDWALTNSSGYGTGDSLVGTWMMEHLVNEEGLEIECLAADGAYNDKRLRRVSARGGGRALIPPKRNMRLTGSQLSQKKSRAYVREPWEEELDEQILACRKDSDGWKKSSGYHVRSLAETTFSRKKRLFGSRIAAKTPERQRVEMGIEVHLLNKFAVRSEA